MKNTALAACVGTMLAIAPALAQNAPPGNPTTRVLWPSNPVTA
jgi:hypothetical protein